MTAALNAGDEVRVSFFPGATPLTNFQFWVDPSSPDAVVCRTETNALILSTVSAPGWARLTQFKAGTEPVSFEPERRPLSQGPVISSPDLRPAIADALVEWDWRMQDGILTPPRAAHLQPGNRENPDSDGSLGRFEAAVEDS